MIRFTRIFTPAQPVLRKISWADFVIISCVIVGLFLLVRLSAQAPQFVKGQAISQAPSALPLYALLSTLRMTAAYVVSLAFSLIYGWYAASNARRERILLPILDILQSIPVLAYLPVVVMSLTAFLPVSFARELAAVLLIFTGQAWNMTFSWYQSLTTIPRELKEASSIFQMNPWMRFKTLQLPFGMIGLVWNSMMSWAGGWFALMACEIYTTNSGGAGSTVQLPGIGTYIQLAADAKDIPALLSGIGTLAAVIVALDQFVWRPMLAYADHFKLEMVSSGDPVRSWFYSALNTSRLVRRLRRRVIRPIGESIDTRLRNVFAAQEESSAERRAKSVSKIIPLAGISVLLVGLFEASLFLIKVGLEDWELIGTGLLGTALRVTLALGLALAWTIPVGYAIGTNARLAKVLQPLTQMVASMPATALYPLFLVGLLHVSGGLEIAAMLLMLAGTQWYLLFNIIAGARAIPQDLRYTAELMGLSKQDRWRTFILPALFPYIATGAITASGGAWNASIFAEYTKFGSENYSTAYGIGAFIHRAQDKSQYPQLMASTLVMVAAVILVNRLVWKKVYATAEERYRME